MNRREFVKSIIVGAVALTICPTDFLTPHSPAPERVVWGELQWVLDEYYTPALIKQLNTPSLLWEKFKKTGKDEYTFEGKIYAQRITAPRKAVGEMTVIDYDDPDWME